jgi:hypothetical protein
MQVENLKDRKTSTKERRKKLMKLMIQFSKSDEMKNVLARKEGKIATT